MPGEIVRLADPGDWEGLAFDITNRADVGHAHDPEHGLIQEAGEHDDVLARRLGTDDRRACHARNFEVFGNQRGNRRRTAIEVVQLEAEAVLVEVTSVLGERPQHLIGRLGDPCRADADRRRCRLCNNGWRGGPCGGGRRRRRSASLRKRRAA